MISFVNREIINIIIMLRLINTKFEKDQLGYILIF